jgi:type II secretory pathway component PulF
VDSMNGHSQFKALFVVAAIVSLGLIVLHLNFALGVVPRFQPMYADLGEVLPLPTRVLASSPPAVTAVVLVIIDAAIFFLMHHLALRHWAWLLFVPIALYLAIWGLLTKVIYLPMSNVINLIK